jgi:hypothetical protein
MDTLYVESSVIGYLPRQPSSDLVNAARQLLTHRWWQVERFRYELVISQYVIDEIAAGDPTLANERLQAIEGIPVLPGSVGVSELGQSIMAAGFLPRKAEVDALHMAIAAYHQIQFLMTWNCTHIANARFFPRIAEVLQRHGKRSPTICTPEELLDDDSEIA